MIVTAECKTSLTGYNLAANETMKLFSIYWDEIRVSKSSFRPRCKFPCYNLVDSKFKRAEIAWKMAEMSKSSVPQPTPTCTNITGCRTSIGLRVSEKRSQKARNCLLTVFVDFACLSLSVLETVILVN